VITPMLSDITGRGWFRALFASYLCGIVYTFARLQLAVAYAKTATYMVPR
jgi:hypothetical protein